MAVKNYIWDFDGMLFDTYPHTLACFVEIYRRHGRVIDPDEAYRLFKITMWDAFDFYGTDEKTKREFYELENDISFPPEGKPYPLIPEILRFISEHGGRNFLYTHRDRVALLYLEKHGLNKYFTDFVTSELNFPLKPAPDAVKYLLDKYSLAPDETMMLGDRAIDAGSGLNAGTYACVFDEDGTIPDAPCTLYVRTTREIFDFVKKNFEETDGRENNKSTVNCSAQ